MTKEIIKFWKNRAIQLSLKTRYCVNCFNSTINKRTPNGFLCFTCEEKEKLTNHEQ